MFGDAIAPSDHVVPVLEEEQRDDRKSVEIPYRYT
jgi:hypothetical protein